MSPRLAKFIATFFYVGDIPLAAGSIASILAIFLHAAFLDQPVIYAGIFIAVTLLGFLSSGPVENVLKTKDPRCIVIDEVSGGMIAFCLLPLNIPVLITAFFVFRAFDMFKIYPACKLEKVPGSIGVMMDDIVAGVYTLIVMQIVLKIVGI